MARKLRHTLVIVLMITLGGAIWMQAQSQTQTYTCATGFGEEMLPPVLLASLDTVPNPVIPKDPVTGARQLRGDLVDYVANLDAAIRLGKALFWDMQVGSDNKTACATCHFQAGQDGRTRNQFAQGHNGQWDGMTPNQDAWAGAYPFTLAGVSDLDNITGSQGVRKATFGGINSKTGVESTTAVADGVFSVGGKNVRQVTGRNAPGVINAVFNHRNFFDGRAQAEFNGVNPFGTRDSSARVWYVGPLGPTQINITIMDASLASQAVGPVLNSVEMSADGRTFPDVGQKLLGVKALRLQAVSPNDSVLGAYADPSGKGLTLTYQSMIQQAFKPKWWNTTKSVTLAKGKSSSMAAANMSLFWGLSVMLYEATLVSDQTWIDKYLHYRSVVGGVPDPTVLDPVVAQLQGDMPGLTRDEILQGLALFELPPPPALAPNGLGCAACHVSAELTSASARNLTVGAEAGDIHFVNAGFDQRMERMFLQLPPVPAGTSSVTLNPSDYTMTAATSSGQQPVGVGTYDAGYYNVGVRPTSDNPGLDGVDPFGNSLSIIKLLKAKGATWVKVPGNALQCGATAVTNPTGFPLLSGPVSTTENVFVAGSYKTPSLRNVELTGPYFHNGGKASLMQVVEFYDDGSDFPSNPTLAPLIKPLGLTAAQRRAIVAFLLSLTDERVRLQMAPFDHPQLFIPNGDSTPSVDNVFELPPTGALGGAPLSRFLNLNPFEQ
jgi:cytochrome c peroxidase